jgi:hypothetical protein
MASRTLERSESRGTGISAEAGTGWVGSEGQREHSLYPSSSGHSSYHSQRLFSFRHCLWERGLRRLVRQVLPTGEEANKARPPGSPGH